MLQAVFPQDDYRCCIKVSPKQGESLQDVYKKSCCKRVEMLMLFPEQSDMLMKEFSGLFFQEVEMLQNISRTNRDADAK